MKKRITIIALFLVLVGSVFAYPVKSRFSKITEFDDDTYYWNLEATTPIELSSKDLDNFISEYKMMGFWCNDRVIPLDKALENHTGPIAEVLLARKYGYYNVYAYYENDVGIVSSHYFVSEKNILVISCTLNKIK